MLQYRFSPLLALLVCLLSFGMLVYGAPALVAKSAGSDLIARGGYNGIEVVAILAQLLGNMKVKLTSLDECYNNGTDPSGIIAEIVPLIHAAVELISGLGGVVVSAKDRTKIVNICVRIIIAIGTHCCKWADKPNFDLILKLCVDIDVALCALLKTVDGPLDTILGLIAGLLGGANLAQLHKLGFHLCLDILGL